MEFVHRTYEKGQTIAAVATPPGDGGVAIIRISGKDAIEIANQIFTGPVHNYASHTAHFGHIVKPDKSVVDDVLLLVMRAPRSYTGEETVEIHCHGGKLITQNVLDVVLAAGARAALPGEFTFQAFRNGKIDLTQAEAVQALIGSKNQLALQAAERQLQGRFRKKIEDFQHQLLELTAIIEAWVDFPEEGLEFASHEEMVLALQGLIGEMQKLLMTYRDGKMLHTGYSLCFLGSPNVGKSSLMNALVGHEKAIVTHVPGTTRDLLEEEIRIGRLHFKLTDTAGIRSTDEIVEKEGVKRSKRAAENADLVLFVADISRPLSHEEKELFDSLPKDKTLLIWNKKDLQSQSHAEVGIEVSAKEHLGLETLKEAIEKKLWKGYLPSKEEVTLTNHRHFQALKTAHEALSTALEGLQNQTSPEFLTSDMRLSLRELGTIIGINVTEEVLTSIFSKFCVGK